jgi:signal transduction histidine kinase
MSTSQLVGYVSISADANPRILDTSDRERLVSCLEVAEFEEILKAIVGLLENERDEDRVKREKEEPIRDLFGKISAEELIEEITSLADEGENAKEAIPLLQAFNKSLDTARKTIEERFVYYSRMATVGTIAQMLVHEIRNRTTSFGTFLEFIKNRFGPFHDENFAKQYRFAENSVLALERLADTFSPLASRTFRRRKRFSVLEERIGNCVEVMSAEFDRKGIRCSIPDTETTVAVDPGEIEAICLNLLTNSGYWLGQADKDSREIQFRLARIDGGKRVRVWVHDSGPGIDKEDIDKVFLPGITRKPGGIGMGLTVASEIVADYGGQMTIKQPGTLGGASFAFDLPVLA